MTRNRQPAEAARSMVAMRPMMILLLVVAPTCIASCGGQTCEDCDEITAAIQAEVDENRGQPVSEGGLEAGQTPCGPQDDPSADVPYYAEACEQLRECLDEAGDCG